MLEIEIKAGVELDKIVAEKVMGYQRLIREDIPFQLRHKFVNGPEHIIYYKSDSEYFCDSCATWFDKRPSYSTSITDAWGIFEKLVCDGCLHKVEYSDIRAIETGRGWTCQIDSQVAFAETAPLAICKAALLYCGDYAEGLL